MAVSDTKPLFLCGGSRRMPPCLAMLSISAKIIGRYGNITARFSQPTTKQKYIVFAVSSMTETALYISMPAHKTLN